jgi:exodeoxyribonuclease V beta subunit
MKRFDVLDRNQEVRGLHFVEASAGTGKTFAIEQLVVRLLLEGASPLTIEQIAVVTFTRAAERELKGRIRCNLETVAECLKGRREAPWDYLKAFLERQEGAQAARRAEDALACFESASIFTIHGFCHRMLSEYALEAAVPIGVPDPDAKEYRSLLKQVVRDYLRAGLKAPHYHPSQMERVLRAHRQRLEAVERKLLAWTEGEAQIPSFPSYEEARQQFCAQLARVGTREAERVLRDFDLLAPCYKKMGGGEARDQMRRIAQVLERGEGACALFDRLVQEGECVLERLAPNNMKVRARLPVETHDPGLFEDLRRALCPSVAAAVDPEKTLLRMAQECRSRFQAFEMLTPDAILRKMAAATARPSFCARVRARFRAAVIDEFQDTDPLQWDIFRSLFVAEKAAMTSVCFVGDPKQSIYAFRGADVSTYLKAREQVGSKSVSCLGTNFRSAEPLVEALNRLFSLPGWLPQLDYRPVAAGGGVPLLSDGRACVQFFVAEGALGRERRWPTLALEEEQLFPFIAQEMQRLQRECGTPYHACAVLVKDRYQARRLQAFLTLWNIPSSLKRSGSLADAQALSAVEELLRAALFPRDLSVLRNALSGPLVGWDCRTLLDENALQRATLTFVRFRETLRQHGVGAFFRAFLQSPYAAVQSDLYEDFRQIVSLLIDRELEGKEPLSFFEEDLEEIQACASDEEGCVQILTMHLSKGLEFPVVFALGVASRHLLHDGYFPLRGQIVAASDAVLDELDAEKMRQLYVAFTRAKQRLYIPIALETAGKTPQTGAASPMELFLQRTGAFDSLEPRIHLLDRSFSLEREPARVSSSPFKTLSCAFDPITVSSFSSLAQKAPPSAPKEASGIPLGAATGTILHRILERITASGLYAPWNQARILAALREETRHTPLEPWQEPLYAMIESAFRLPLCDGRATFNLLEVSPERMQQEMDFLFPTDGGYMKGCVDLVFEKAGRFYLLDWKSNWLPVYDVLHMEEEMRRCDYGRQAALYAEALKRHLGRYGMEERFGGFFYLFLRGPAVYYGN